MKITKLTTENVKRVKAVTIEPDGNLVIVGGKNASGKTSTIGSIAMAIGGKRLCPDVPIRKGEKNAKAEVVLDNGMVVTRTFTSGGSMLKVEAGDGRAYTSPQALLDGLVGELGFDPLSWMRKKPKEQGAMLCELVGIDTAVIDEERKKLYDERTLANRELKKTELRLQTIAYDDDLPTEEVPLAELIAELKRRQSANASLHAKQLLLGQTRAEYSTALANALELEAKARALRDRLDRLAEQGSVLSEEVKTTREADEGAVEAEINGIEARNRQVRENKRWGILSEEEGILAAESNRLSEEIDKVDKRRAELILSASYPVPGMGVDGDLQVTLDGLPFNQASSAQQLRCSVAMGLAFNPKLRVMVIEDGSLLDEDSLAILSEMADEADAQVWIERVSEGEECTVIIEDGIIKS